MWKKRIIALVAAIALTVAAAGASSAATDVLATWINSGGQTIACNNGSGSGGGC